MHRESGCLYRLDIDPTEEHSIAAAEPGVFKEMLAELDAAQVSPRTLMLSAYG